MTKAIEDWKVKKYGRMTTEEELHKRTHPAWPNRNTHPKRPFHY